MRLTKHSDYALRVLMYAASYPERLVSTEEIGVAHGISTHHLVKIVNKLGKSGLLQLKRGRSGGLTLGRSASEITIGEVVRLTEPDFFMVECFDPQTNECPLTKACALIPPLRKATEVFLAELDRYTLEDVTRGKRRDRYRRLLPLVE